MTICESITRGGKEFHFLWGRYDYKFMLGAVQRDLDNVVVYRNHVQLMRNAGFAGRIAYEGYLRRLKVWLKYGDSFLSQATRKLTERMRNLKRSIPELPAGNQQAFSNSGREH
jgi:hypothetical protein